MLRFPLSAFLLLLVASAVSSFSVQRRTATGRTCFPLSASPSSPLEDSSFAERLHEFDYLLNEGQPSSQVSLPHSRRRIALPNGASSSDLRTTVLTASTASFPGAAPVEDAAVDDPYAEGAADPQLEKIHQLQQQQPPSLTQKIKSMDFQDIVITLFVPGLVAFVAGRWGFNRVSGRMLESRNTALDAFAREMIYHDGNLREMELCVTEYGRKLAWLGPTKTDAMLKRYLENYAKKKTISPQAIASLSNAFSYFKLSESKAASLLVALCHEMGTDKISSAGKLLFLGSRILKSPEGVAALSPIKDLIKSTYRDAEVAEMLVDTSQQAIADAAYRSAVQSGGKNQQELTVGWEVLGLDRDTAQRIFEEEAEEGFVSDREAMYGGQSTKYDKSGRRLADDGSLENPEEAGDDEEDDDDGPVSNVYECGNCGHTMFVAQGRESKFFGPDFRCPDCGAKKDQFKARDDLD